MVNFLKNTDIYWYITNNYLWKTVIRKTKHLNKEYLIVDTELHVMENDNVFVVPIHIQVNLSKINEKNHYTIYQHINSMFNYVKIVGKKKEVQKNPWWKFWKKNP